MNTDTRKHAEEKSAYDRKSKYREDLLDDEEVVTPVDDGEDGGVLADYPGEPEDVVEEEHPVMERPKRKRGQ